MVIYRLHPQRSQRLTYSSSRLIPGNPGCYFGLVPLRPISAAFLTFPSRPIANLLVLRSPPSMLALLSAVLARPGLGIT
jgi:hypothetical protein